MRATLLLVLPLLCLLGSAAAQSPLESRLPSPEQLACPGSDFDTSRPWQWSPEERLARRFDPAAMKERSSPEATEPFGISVERAPQLARDVVIGKRNPELFLPFEVFRHLAATAFAPDLMTRNIFRYLYEQKSRPLGISPDIWAALERVASPYLNSLEEERSLAAGLAGASAAAKRRILAAIKVVQEPQCELRFQALSAARQAIGREIFDRFLYQVVAPQMTVHSDDEPDPARLRYIDGGCK
jgi:hypothetical protein